MMLRPVLGGFAIVLVCGTTAWAAEFDAKAAHQPFMEAFNARDWEGVKSSLAQDAVFHRANAEEVYVGPDAIVGRFSDTIGNPDQWNVKFASLESEDQITGEDGRVVERGDFAITAGGDDGECYAGSYMATWAPSADEWKLQVFAWQDVKVDMSECN
ncbi:MAG TPA: nuclear transport factor 2 family protein [Geminicoccaceae bacterium]